MENSSDSSTFSEDSDDEQVINFIERLGRQRKVPRFQLRIDHFHYWDDGEFYCRFRLSKETAHSVPQNIRNNCVFCRRF